MIEQVLHRMQLLIFSPSIGHLRLSSGFPSSNTPTFIGFLALLVSS
jgi:hypothetical protein